MFDSVVKDITRMVREAIDIEKRPSNLNKRDAQRLVITWKHVLAERRIMSNSSGLDRRDTVVDHIQSPENQPHTRVNTLNNMYTYTYMYTHVYLHIYKYMYMYIMTLEYF